MPPTSTGGTEADGHAFGALVDRLGIFHGLDPAAHRGTYVDGEDRLNWEQGVVRIALGAFMDDEAPFAAPFGHRNYLDFPYLPEAAPIDDASGPRFARLVRSLSSDVRFARSAQKTLREWARFMAALLTAYLEPTDSDEEAAFRRALGAIGEIAELSLSVSETDERAVSYAFAHELLRARLNALATARGHGRGDGVAVSSLMPMRTIPFRVIFVLGLGEGRFPASDRRDALDLRAARRHAGDVTPRERDRYTFLETLLSARERLYLSYVGRDEQTGDELAPSTVVQELLETVEHAYLRDAGRLVRRPPLRRHDDDAVCRVQRSAAEERRAAKLGKSFRAERPREAGRLPLERTGTAAEALGLLPIPRPNSDPELGSRSAALTLAALRRFLESPLQGWTRAVLRLDELRLGGGELENGATRTDEPFTAGALDTTMTLREAFSESVLRDIPIEDAYRARVERLKARGRWPLGPLAELEAERHRALLATWRKDWDALPKSDWSGRIRFGRAVRGDPVRGDPVRSDPVRGDPAERAEPAIEIDFSTGEREHRVELSGRTELLRTSPRVTVIPTLRKRSGAVGRFDAWRFALRAFFDHAALSASGRGGAPHRCVRLFGTGERPQTVDIDPLEPSDARAWLGTLCRELLLDTHAYAFPIEAVLRCADRIEEVDGTTLVRSIEHVRRQFSGGYDRYGPVRDATDYPTPSPSKARKIVENRFVLPLTKMRAGFR